MEKPVRLNLGSGRHYWPGFVNIDHDSRADIVGDVRRLQVEDESVDEIHAIHLFEHFPRLEVHSILMDWKRALKPGGKIVLELPSLSKIAQMIVDGEEAVALTLFGIFGDIREKSPFMKHQWAYTEKEIVLVFNECGMQCEVVEPVFHMKQRDMRVIGVK